MIATKIFVLSAIGKKLATPPTTNGRHLGFWPPESKNLKFFLGNFLIRNQHIYTVLKNARNHCIPGGADMVFLPPPLKYMCIAVQETKRKKDSNFNITNYTHIDEPLETDGIAHGGVGFFIHNDVMHHRINLNTKFQAIAIHAYLHKRITIYNIYINPQPKFLTGRSRALIYATA